MVKILLVTFSFFSVVVNMAIGQSIGFDYSGMDKSVQPGDDFNTHVNGKWLKDTEIPGDQSRWGSFMLLREESNKRLRSIMEESASKGNTGNVAEKKIGDFYASAMDTNTINKLGNKPLMTYLRRVDMLNNIRSLIVEVGYMHVIGFNPFYSFFAYQDDKNSSKVIAQLGQPRLGLPEKGYYFDNDENKKKIRDAYLKYISNLFKYCGESDELAVIKANKVLEFEKKLANASKNAIELRDPEANYNKITASKLSELLPNLDLTYLQNSLMIQEDTFIVGQPEYFKALDQLIIQTPFNELKDYLKFKYISGIAPHLSNDFQRASFDFNKEFSGQKVQAERGKRMVDLVNSKLGELIGELYVQKHFPPQAKVRMLELVKNLQTAYEARILSADWMSQETKTKAVQKLNGMLLKIGYPDKWKDYSTLDITRDNFVQNIMNSNKFEHLDMIGKLKKPVDRNEWQMTPATVNAYYNPQTNEIAFPAAILQPPFFNIDADDAINYGAIGAVIGHEMTHGFDDQGRLYDVKGNLGDWWTPEDAKAYELRSKKVVEQYNSYTVYDTVHVKGDLTLGENIADLGGMAIAYDAFRKTDQCKSGQLIDGYTPEQRFFLGFGQIWRSKSTRKFMLNRINTDPHSPEEFRIKGSVSNFSPWYKAFGVNPENKMYKPEGERIQVW